MNGQKQLLKVVLALLFVSGIFIACSVSDSDTSNDEMDEFGQQIGDSMAAIDASGGNSSGAYSLLDWQMKKMVAKIDPLKFKERLSLAIFPRSEAASCLTTTTFGSCSDNVIVRNFNNCTILGATFSGTVTFTFDDGVTDNLCTFSSSGDTVTRDPDFSVTGRSGATFAVEKSGSVGQKLTRTSTSNQYLFSNDGIRRTFTDSTGDITIDFTSRTTADITVTGTSRNGRVMTGGTLQVVNNLTSESCNFSPEQVTWGDSCNCATSGTWTGECSDGDDSELEITGCGTGVLTIGDDSTSVTFDRCSES